MLLFTNSKMTMDIDKIENTIERATTFIIYSSKTIGYIKTKKITVISNLKGQTDIFRYRQYVIMFTLHRFLFTVCDHGLRLCLVMTILCFYFICCKIQ